MPEQEDSFRDKSLKDKTVTVVGVALLLIFVLGFLFGLYFFGLAGIFKLLGVQYESIWSFVIFVISFIVVGLIFELFTRAIFELAFRNIEGKKEWYFIGFLIDGLTSWFVLFTVDEFMGSITLSIYTEMIIAFVFAGLEMVFAGDKEKKDSIDRSSKKEE